MDITSYYSAMDAGQTTGSVVGGIIGYLITVILLWRVFSKAGRPGWLAIIPIVNLIVLIQVSGHSGWWILLIWIPIVGWIISIVFSVDLAHRFGKGGAFGFFLIWLLSLIGFIILAFDSSTYRKATTA